MDDHIIRCLLKDRPVRVVAAVTTGIGLEAARRHGVVAGGQVALSRAATSGLLVATLSKGKERVTLQVLGDGPLGGAVVDARAKGDVRAYLKEPGVLIPATPGERVRLFEYLGRKGIVSVIRDLGLKQRFQGQSSMLSGEIDADVEHYLTTSEQIESAMGCDAVLGGDGSIVAAGGVLVQCMPDGGQTNMVAEMWRRLRFDAVFDTLKSRPGITAEDLARAVLGEFADELDVLDIRPVQFHCDCTLERVCESLTLIASDELQAMIDEDEGAEITCDFCRETYVFNAAQLIAIRDAAGPRATS